MNLAPLLENNYEYLKTVAKRITRCKNYKMADDLINSTYLSIHAYHEGGMRVPEDNEGFVKFFSKCMKNYFTWPNSEFNKSRKMDCDEQERKRQYDRNWERGSLCETRYNYDFKKDNFSGAVDENPEGIEGIADNDALRNIEISVEQANDFTRELIEISSNLGRDKTLRYIELVDFKRTLPAHELILFELYFEKEMSTRQIAKEYSMECNEINYQSINRLVNVIKSKLKDHQWKQLNL